MSIDWTIDGLYLNLNEVRIREGLSWSDLSTQAGVRRREGAVGMTLLMGLTIRELVLLTEWYDREGWKTSKETP